MAKKRKKLKTGREKRRFETVASDLQSLRLIVPPDPQAGFSGASQPSEPRKWGYSIEMIQQIIERIKTI